MGSLSAVRGCVRPKCEEKKKTQHEQPQPLFYFRGAEAATWICTHPYEPVIERRRGMLLAARCCQHVSTLVPSLLASSLSYLPLFLATTCLEIAGLAFGWRKAS